MRNAVTIPVVDVRDVVAAEVLARGHDSLALLGTRYLVNDDFYSGRLDQLGVRCVKPDGEQTDGLQAIIYNELTKGVVSDASRDYLCQVAAVLSRARRRRRRPVLH